jgi:23S rRNA-/tRNA-specific pseudouridylate synthase
MMDDAADEWTWRCMVYNISTTHSIVTACSMSTDCNTTITATATSGTASSGGGVDSIKSNNNNSSKTQSQDDDHNTAFAAFQKIPQRLRIQVIYHDDDIIVVSKPCGLRSVPGNANSEAKASLSLLDTDGSRKRPRSPSPAGAVSTAATAASSSQHQPQPQQRLTAQQAWTEAIRLLATTNTNSSSSSIGSNSNSNSTSTSNSVVQQQHLMNVYLQRLGSNNSHLASIPRKFAPFCRYIRRSHARIFKNDDKAAEMDDVGLETLIKQIYCCIEKRQRSLMQLPEPTRHEESVLGQLKLLGLSSSLENAVGNDDDVDSRSYQDLFPVHRLDCETSGVMVVARNRNAASVLSRAWREKSKLQKNSNNKNNNNDDSNNAKADKNNCSNKKIIKVHKVYHALVYDWKPWREQQQTQGQIDLALAPHPTERIKWVAVHPDDDSSNNGNGSSKSAAAKPSLTHWKVLENHSQHHRQKQHDEQKNAAVGTSEEAATSAAAAAATTTTSSDTVVRLELLPITGRTHQLRIHCAETGGAIIGDSLYAAAVAAAASSGDDRILKKSHDDGKLCLHLHAYQLTFPHPRNEEREMKFTVDPAW